MKGSSPRPATAKPKAPANPPASHVKRLTPATPASPPENSAGKQLKARVQKFLDLYDKKAALDAEYKKKANDLQEKLEEAQAELLGELNVAGLDQLKGPETGGRTIKKDRKVVATIDDFDAIWQYMKDNDVPELLQKRLSSTAVKDRQEAGEVIPGVGKFEKITLNVTK